MFKKNQDKYKERTVMFKYMEEPEIIFDFLITHLKKKWKFEFVNSVNKIFKTQLNLDGHTCHAEIKTLNNEIDFKITRKNIGYMVYSFSVFKNKNTIMIAKISVELEEKYATNKYNYLKATKSFGGLSKDIDNEIRNMLENKGLKSYF